MRTTVDIPDVLYRRLKSRAALEGRSVKELLVEAAESALQPPPPARRARRVQPPLIRSTQPGSLDIDNARIYDLISFP